MVLRDTDNNSLDNNRNNNSKKYRDRRITHAANVFVCALAAWFRALHLYTNLRGIFTARSQ
jgi:hypothetical protein